MSFFDPTTRVIITETGAEIPVIGAGAGPDLVVVHGGMDTPRSWIAVAGEFTGHRVWLLDRTTLADAGASLDEEAEALDAVIRAVASAPPVVLGHSYGAVVVLHALLTRDIDCASVVLYEPPLPVGGPVVGALLPEIEAAVEADDLEGALRLYLTQIARFPAELVERQATNPRLQAMVPTLLPELRAVDNLPWTVEHLRQVRTPALLLLGDQSAEHPLRNTTTALAKVLPQAQLVTMPRFGHFAHQQDPEYLAALVKEHLAATSARAA